MTEKYHKGALPPYKPPEKTKTQKDKGKRQKITRRKKPPCRHSWMFLSSQVHHPGDFRAVFSLPLDGSITLRSSPRQSLSRGLQYLKTWIPA